MALDRKLVIIFSFIFQNKAVIIFHSSLENVDPCFKQIYLKRLLLILIRLQGHKSKNFIKLEYCKDLILPNIW